MPAPRDEAAGSPGRRPAGSRSNPAGPPDSQASARDARSQLGSSDCALKWVPVIDAEKCTGCNLCVEACGPKCLTLIDGVAVLSAPDICGSEEHCIPACESGAIRMQWVGTDGDRSRGRWRDAPR